MAPRCCRQAPWAKAAAVSAERRNSGGRGAAGLVCHRRRPVRRVQLRLTHRNWKFESIPLSCKPSVPQPANGVGDRKAPLQGHPDQPTSPTPADAKHWSSRFTARRGYRLLPDEPLDAGFISGTIELAR